MKPYANQQVWKKKCFLTKIWRNYKERTLISFTLMTRTYTLVWIVSSFHQARKQTHTHTRHIYFFSYRRLYKTMTIVMMIAMTSNTAITAPTTAPTSREVTEAENQITNYCLENNWCTLVVVFLNIIDFYMS